MSKTRYTKANLKAMATGKRLEGKVPIMLHKDNGSDLGELDGHILSVHKLFTVSELQIHLRKFISLRNTDALYLVIRPNLVATPGRTLDSFYEEYHSKEDGWLHVIYSRENTYGYY